MSYLGKLDKRVKDLESRKVFTPTIPDTLLIVFITLKLTNNIDWSWWWVLSPLLFGITLMITASIIDAVRR